MDSSKNNELFKEIFGEHGDITNSAEPLLMASFLGSEREASLLKSEDPSMLTTMLCSLPRTYAITVVARATSGTLKPSYVAIP